MITPRFGWLDRWLEPRWRALLTWVVIAVPSGFVLEIDWRWINEGAGFVHRTVQRLSGISLPFAFHQYGAWSPPLLFLYWFPPVLLRLGSWRTGIWLTASILLGIADIVWIFQSIGRDWWPGSTRLPLAILFGQLFGLPGLAAIGRRTRVWVTFPASVLASAIAFVALPHPSAHFAFAMASVIYGAVMLYGTDPLPRRAAERQLGED
jgi:hypothetical protein